MKMKILAVISQQIPAVSEGKLNARFQNSQTPLQRFEQRDFNSYLIPHSKNSRYT